MYEIFYVFIGLNLRCLANKTILYGEQNAIPYTMGLLFLISFEQIFFLKKKINQNKYSDKERKKLKQNSHTQTIILH